METRTNEEGRRRYGFVALGCLAGMVAGVLWAGDLVCAQVLSKPVEVKCLSGEVKDAKTGQTLDSAYVVIDTLEEAAEAELGLFERIRDDGEYMAARTGKEGTFVMEDVPMRQGLPVIVTRYGYEPQRLRVNTTEDGSEVELAVGLEQNTPEHEGLARGVADLIWQVWAEHLIVMAEQEKAEGDESTARMAAVPDAQTIAEMPQVQGSMAE